MDIASDHVADDSWRVDRGCFAREHELAIAQDGDPVGETFEFLHAVGDIDDGQALRFELRDDAEEFFALLLREDGGGLIHHDDSRRSCQRAGDFDQLLLGAGEAGDAGIGRDGEVMAFENFLRLGVELAVIEESGRPLRLHAEEDVFGHGQIVGEDLLLERSC